ncbi:MAG: TrkA family potassium uptake protein [Clostridiales bacterium]|nr:TrkA family potassium uptake protein [Clostridiales bacterium]
MVSVLLIGMGKFGRTLGEKLLAMGDEVMIVDKDEDKINALASKYTNALITNCMTEENLATMDIPSFDVCIVAIGDDFQSSLEITSILKDLGAKRVISRATTMIQRKFLLRVGADEVIFPDLDIAERMAIKINTSNVINFVDFEDYAIFELPVPDKWVKRSIIEVNPRGKFGMNILMVKKGEQDISMPNGDYVFDDGDLIVVFGETENIL